MRFRRHRPVGRFCRSFADHHLRRHKRLAPPARARLRHPQRPTRAQAGRQLAPQRAPALDVKRLVDGLVADAHGLVSGKVEPQALCDLLRTPRACPAPGLPGPMSTALPGHGRSGHCSPARGSDRAGQAILHIVPQHRVGGQPCRLRATGRPFGVPLRRGRPVIPAANAARFGEFAAARGRVAAQLARNRRRRPPQAACRFPYAQTLCSPQRDLLPLGKAKMPARGRLCRDGQM